MTSSDQIDTIAYFGYGSLVNEDTRKPESVSIRGTLHGWVREWRIAGNTPTGRVCGLTVSPKPGSDILGVLIIDAASELPALDAREARYDRHALPPEHFRAHADGHEDKDDAFLYRSKAEHYRWGDDDHPIRLSYVDCVLKGYLDQFGEDGPRHFIETTDGWHTPVLNDRARPLYPRAVDVPAADQALFDDLLIAAGVRFI